MESAADKRRGDPEADHSRADDLLVETIEWVCDRDASSSWTPWLREILANYEKVGKWYA
jgi:hypothetical protein